MSGRVINDDSTSQDESVVQVKLERESERSRSPRLEDFSEIQTQPSVLRATPKPVRGRKPGPRGPKPIRYTFVDTAGQRLGAKPGECSCCVPNSSLSLDNWKVFAEVSLQPVRVKDYPARILAALAKVYWV